MELQPYVRGCSSLLELSTTAKPNPPQTETLKASGFNNAMFRPNFTFCSRTGAKTSTPMTAATQYKQKETEALTSLAGKPQAHLAFMRALPGQCDDAHLRNLELEAHTHTTNKLKNCLEVEAACL